jgi:drug/metabolite transporter (DMT)-like permease
MKLVKLIEFLRQRLKTVVRICLGLLTLLILVDALFVDKEHAHTRIEHLPAFWSIFGFLGCVLIIIGSKWFGHAGIMTREDYYDE